METIGLILVILFIFGLGCALVEEDKKNAATVALLMALQNKVDEK